MFVFAYGSLIWNPGFDYSRRFKGSLNGYKRDYSIIETHHRGKENLHGLVLGIHEDNQYNTQGILFHINDNNWKKTYNYLQERENPDNEYYLEKKVTVNSFFGKFEALTFISNQNNDTFFNLNCINKKAEIIKKASGLSGTNLEYFEKNLFNLSKIGLIDNNDIHFKINQILKI